MQKVDFNHDTRNERMFIRRIFSYVKSKVSILDVLRHFKCDLRGYPGNIHCVFHDEKNPSARVRLDRKQYYCYAGCGHGDIFWLVQKFTGLRDNTSVLQYINEHFNLNLEDPSFLAFITRGEHRVGDDVERCLKRDRESEGFCAVATKRVRENLPYELQCQFDVEMDYLWSERDSAWSGFKYRKDFKGLFLFVEAWETRFCECLSKYCQKARELRSKGVKLGPPSLAEWGGSDGGCD